MVLNLTTIATNIAGISVSGVTIKDLSAIPPEVIERDAPMLIPNPAGYMSNVQVVRDSYGSSEAKQHITYDLTYRYLHSRVGSGRSNLLSEYQSMVAKTALILDAIIANDALSGQIDLVAAGLGEFGPVEDPSGNVFHGCDIVINVMEFIN